MYGLRVTALALKTSKDDVAYAWAVVSISPLLESKITGISEGMDCNVMFNSAHHCIVWSKNSRRVTFKTAISYRGAEYCC